MSVDLLRKPRILKGATWEGIGIQSKSERYKTIKGEEGEMGY